jgi:hypothetical protein
VDAVILCATSPCGSRSAFGHPQRIKLGRLRGAASAAGGSGTIGGDTTQAGRKPSESERRFRPAWVVSPPVCPPFLPGCDLAAPRRRPSLMRWGCPPRTAAASMPRFVGHPWPTGGRVARSTRATTARPAPLSRGQWSVAVRTSEESTSIIRVTRMPPARLPLSLVRFVRIHIALKTALCYDTNGHGRDRRGGILRKRSWLSGRTAGPRQRATEWVLQ